MNCHKPLFPGRLYYSGLCAYYSVRRGIFLNESCGGFFKGKTLHKVGVNKAYFSCVFDFLHNSSDVANASEKGKHNVAV